MTLKEKLEELKIGHFEWCKVNAMVALVNKDCNCGTDQHNKKVDELINSMKHTSNACDYCRNKPDCKGGEFYDCFEGKEVLFNEKRVIKGE